MDGYGNAIAILELALAQIPSELSLAVSSAPKSMVNDKEPAGGLPDAVAPLTIGGGGAMAHRGRHADGHPPSAYRQNCSISRPMTLVRLSISMVNAPEVVTVEGAALAFLGRGQRLVLGE